MAALTSQKVDQDGLVTPTYAAASAGGDTFAPGDRIFIHVKNTDASPHNVVVDDPRSKSPEGATQYNPDVTVSVPATTGSVFIGPLYARRFRSPADNQVHISYAATTGMTVAVLELEASPT